MIRLILHNSGLRPTKMIKRLDDSWVCKYSLINNFYKFYSTENVECKDLVVYKNRKEFTEKDMMHEYAGSSYITDTNVGVLVGILSKYFNDEEIKLFLDTNDYNNALKIDLFYELYHKLDKELNQINKAGFVNKFEMGDIDKYPLTGWQFNEIIGSNEDGKWSVGEIPDIFKVKLVS